jgi:hypothetical protein
MLKMTEPVLTRVPNNPGFFQTHTHWRRDNGAVHPHSQVEPAGNRKSFL